MSLRGCRDQHKGGGVVYFGEWELRIFDYDNHLPWSGEWEGFLAIFKKVVKV